MATGDTKDTLTLTFMNITFTCKTQFGADNVTPIRKYIDVTSFSMYPGAAQNTFRRGQLKAIGIDLHQGGGGQLNLELHARSSSTPLRVEFYYYNTKEATLLVTALQEMLIARVDQYKSLELTFHSRE